MSSSPRIFGRNVRMHPENYAEPTLRASVEDIARSSIAHAVAAAGGIPETPITARPPTFYRLERVETHEHGWEYRETEVDTLNDATGVMLCWEQRAICPDEGPED